MLLFALTLLAATGPEFYVRGWSRMECVGADGREHQLRFPEEFKGHVSPGGMLAFLDDDESLCVYRRDKLVRAFPFKGPRWREILGWVGERVEYQDGARKFLLDPVDGKSTPTDLNTSSVQGRKLHPKLKLRMDAVYPGRSSAELLGVRPRRDEENPSKPFPPSSLYLIAAKSGVEKLWFTVQGSREVVCFSADKSTLYTIRWNWAHDNVGLIATRLSDRTERVVAAGAIWAQPVRP